jgi:hypothetical protein
MAEELMLVEASHRALRACVTLLILLSAAMGVRTYAQEVTEQQRQDGPAPTPHAEAPTWQKSQEEILMERKEQSHRVLGMLPQFSVTNRQDAPPLSHGEKFHLFLKSAFDPASIGIVGLQSAISQADNQFPAYGQGAAGYGKRFGAALADELDAGFWSNFAYPIFLKEDPRYFRLGEGNFKHRVFYSMAQEFVSHTDRGGRSFNFSNVLGAFTSGAISNLYYPGKTLIRTIPASATSPAIPIYENERGAELTVSRASIALSYGLIGGLFDEFWPDIQGRLFRKRQNARASPAP